MPPIEVEIKVVETEAGKIRVETVEGAPIVVYGATLPEAMGKMCAILESKFKAKVDSVAGLSFHEAYTLERKAEFILSSAIDAEDYAEAVKEVQKLGLDPKTVPHYKPAGV